MVNENEELLEAEIDKLIEIYEMLISQPTPEEEEQAQRDLLVILKDVKDMLGDFDQFHELDELYQTISNWDTLESWFYEISGLEEKLVQFLSKFRHVKKRQKEPREASISIPQDEIEAEDSKFDQEKESRIDKTFQTVEKKMKSLMTRDSLIHDDAPSQAHIETISKSTDHPHLKSKLVAPKIVIPPVMAPKKKITPDTISYSNVGQQTQEDAPIKIDYTPPESQSKSPPNPKFQPKINPISSSQKTIKIHPITSDQFRNSQSTVDQTDDLNKLSSKELYRELIKLEAKQYHLIKQQKILEEKFNAKQISESLFNITREETNIEVRNCVNKIQHIKSIINR